METRGRKRKKEVSLTGETNNINSQYIDYSAKSLIEQSLIWEYKNPQTGNMEIHTYPLSRAAAIKYWENKIMIENDQHAKSILSRIQNRSHYQDDQRQIYDNYPQLKNLIDQFLYSASEFCTIKNSSKRTGGQYGSAITALVKFFSSKFDNIRELKNIDEHVQSSLYNELTRIDNRYFYTSIKTFAKNILIDALERNNMSAGMLKQNIKGGSHSGKKTRLDYPQEVAIQLLAISASEISNIIANHEEYQSWKKDYKGKSFDSLENLAKAYISIPEHFKNIKSISGRSSAIQAYCNSYNKLCIEIHNISLNKMDKNELIVLSKDGYNIDALDNPYIMSWFLDDIQHNFPFNVASKATSDIPMSNYTRWSLHMPLRHYLSDRGSRRKKDFLATYKDIFSRKYPTAEKIMPFILFWMMQTGCNPEAVVNMKRKEKGVNGAIEIGEHSPLGDTTVVRSFKNRGTKDYYWFALNPNEEGGLFTNFIFLKSFLALLWDEDAKTSDEKEIWPFWVYYSPLKSKKIIHTKWSNLKSQLDTFVKNHNIILSDGSTLESLELSRLRNTFITMADLGGSSIEEIQEWIKHGDFDTRFKFYSNSPDQRSRNFSAIHAIQEDIIENARNFQGHIENGSLKKSINAKKVTATLISGCSDPKQPSYIGAKKIPKKHVCIDWDMCLFCQNSRVFYDHLPRICARILQYKSYQKKMTTDEWENNFGTKDMVARDALERWIADGGDEEDIMNAWKLARDGNIALPPIFPSGSMLIANGETYAA